MKGFEVSLEHLKHAFKRSAMISIGVFIFIKINAYIQLEEKFYALLRGLYAAFFQYYSKILIYYHRFRRLYCFRLGSLHSERINKEYALLALPYLIIMKLHSSFFIIVFIYLFYFFVKIFYLRRGRLDMVTRNAHHFTIDKAAVYIGLQAVHSSIAFFILWVWVTIFAVTIQV